MPKYTPSGQIAELTSIRGFAALSVVIYHFFFDDRNTTDIPTDFISFINNIIADGHLGVDLFFVLSGFILSHVYLSQVEAKQFDAKKFYIARLARVYPLHLCMLLIFLVIYPMASLMGINTGGQAQDWGAFIPNVLLVHAWGFTDSHSWNFPSWSVSAEFFAYIIFPIMIGVVLKLRPVVAFWASLCLFALASVAVYLAGAHITKLMYNFGIVRIFFEFLVGIAFYRIFLAHKMPDRIVKLSSYILPLIIIGLSAFQVNEPTIVLFIALLILSFAGLSRIEENNILRHKSLIYLGEISYSIYMVHILFRTVFNSVIGKLDITSPFLLTGAYLVVLALIIISSMVLYHWVETPCRIRVKKFLSAKLLT